MYIYLFIISLKPKWSNSYTGVNWHLWLWYIKARLLNNCNIALVNNPVSAYDEPTINKSSKNAVTK